MQSLFTNLREHVLQATLGDAPVRDVEALLVRLDINEEHLRIEAFQGNLVDEVAIELPDQLSSRDVGPQKLLQICHYVSIQLLVFFMSPHVHKQMVAASILRFQMNLRPNAPQQAIVDYANSVTENVGLLHRVCRDHHRLRAPQLCDYIPELSPVFRVQACARLIQVDDFRV